MNRKDVMIENFRDEVKTLKKKISELEKENLRLRVLELGMKRGGEINMDSSGNFYEEINKL